LDALATGPLTQQELIARVREGASPGMRVWLKGASNAFRSAIVDGLICYGPPQGSAVTFARVDRWLPPQPTVDPASAQRTLVRRFLSACGPADVRDFRHWSGLSTADASAAWSGVSKDLREVSIDGRTTYVLDRDSETLARAKPDPSIVRLLPSF